MTFLNYCKSSETHMIESFPISNNIFSLIFILSKFILTIHMKNQLFYNLRILAYYHLYLLECLYFFRKLQFIDLSRFWCQAIDTNFTIHVVLYKAIANCNMNLTRKTILRLIQIVVTMVVLL